MSTSREQALADLAELEKSWRGMGEFLNREDVKALLFDPSTFPGGRVPDIDLTDSPSERRFRSLREYLSAAELPLRVEVVAHPGGDRVKIYGDCVDENRDAGGHYVLVRTDPLELT